MTDAQNLGTNEERGVFTDGRSFDPLGEPTIKTESISEDSKRAIESALRSKYFIPEHWEFRGNCVLSCIDEFRRAFLDNHGNNGTYIEIIPGSFFVHIDKSKETSDNPPIITVKESDGLGAVFEVPIHETPALKSATEE